MSLETPVNYLDNLVATNPVSGDVRSEGDDHIRNIKIALKQTFPGLVGRAFRVQTKSATYAPAVNDNMTLFRCTAAMNLNPVAAATLGDGFLFFVYADGFDVTIDPNGAETINGGASIIIPSGFMAVVFCSGTAFYCSIMLPSFAKGTILVGDSSGTPRKLAVGTDGQVLVADSTAANGIAWASSGFTTGDVKLTIKTTADAGWVLMNDGTIGNASSGATTRANADTEQLFTLLWNNTANADCAVSTGRGASAAADFAANKTIALPKALGRALAGYGAGSGLTSRALASVTGTETHTLTAAEMPAHTHSIDGYNDPGGSLQVTSNGAGSFLGQTNTGSAGSGGAHANMQPTLFLNVMIRL